MKYHYNQLVLIHCFALYFTDFGESLNVKEGYVLYCPCMGRFGNQAEQFLGSIGFAIKLNRTLIVPPWIQYDYSAKTQNNNIFVPYEEWFSINELSKCYPNKVVSLKYFMDNIAPNVWMDKKIYCPKGAMERSEDGASCPAKDGNPFGPFWNNANVNFTGGSEMFPQHLSYQSNAKEWNEAFPLENHPVLTFMGPPASFPIQEKHRWLQKCIKFSDNIEKEANIFIKEKIKSNYIAIHLRNGPDWKRACSHMLAVGNHFMASPQCVGYDLSTSDKLNDDMCLPSMKTIMQKIDQVSKKHNIKTLFVATDNDPMLQSFRKKGYKVIQYDENSVIMDIAILAMADVFIGNCISSFSSFVVRHREVSKNKPVYFFGFNKPHPPIKENLHEEL